MLLSASSHVAVAVKKLWSVSLKGVGDVLARLVEQGQCEAGRGDMLLARTRRVHSVHREVRHLEKSNVLTCNRASLSIFVHEITHAEENCVLFLERRDYNNYGNNYARLCWTGLGLRADIVESTCY